VVYDCCGIAQVMEVVAAYKDAGLPPTVFAAAVPKNWSRSVSALVAELYEDDTAAVRPSRLRFP
jgi:hypothetical protein